jgi:hypothetical protein
VWTWTLNWNAVTPRIVVGSCPMRVADLETIRAATGIGAVLSLQHDECLRQFGIDYAALERSARAARISMRRVPIRDFDVPDMRRHLPAAVRALGALLARGRRVYVHCTAGMGRGPLAVLGYLSFAEGMRPETALRLLQERRPCVCPSWEAFQGCREDLLAPHRRRIARRASRFYRVRRGSGGEGGPAQDWQKAEEELLRELALEGEISALKKEGEGNEHGPRAPLRLRA